MPSKAVHTNHWNVANRQLSTSTTLFMSITVEKLHSEGGGTALDVQNVPKKLFLYYELHQLANSNWQKGGF